MVVDDFHALLLPMRSLIFDAQLFPPQSALDREKFEDIGGKARGLARLRAAGLPVPPWAVIPASVAETRPWRSNLRWQSNLRRLFDTFGSDRFEGLVVRSSATGEDEANDAFPGLFCSHHVLHPDSVIDAIEKVNSSVDSDRVRSYVRRKRIQRIPRMAVIVQSRVRSRLSGVAFSTNPARAKATEIYIEMVEGYANQLTEGSKSPWSFGFDVGSLELRTSSPILKPLPAAVHDVLTCLVQYVLRAEKEFECPLDLEWAADASSLWIVQARASGSLTPSSDSLPDSCATSWFFDQRFSQPIPPLTRTTLIPTILKVAIQEALVMRWQTTPEPLFFDFWGQVYVAHEAYRRIFGGIPRWMLTPDLRQLFPAFCTCSEKERTWWRGYDTIKAIVAGVLLVARNWRDILLNVQEWRSLQRRLPALLESIETKQDSDRVSWLRCWESLTELTERLLRLHRWSILLADIGYNLFIYFLRLFPKQLQRRLRRRLLEGLQLPTSGANQELASFFQDGCSANLDFDDFIKRFGHRSGSIDHSEGTWGELLSEGTLPIPLKLTETRRSSQEIVSRPHPRPPLWMRPLAALLQLREEQRFEWEKVLAKQRAMIMQAARKLHSRAVLKSLDDIWYLEWDEFLGVLFGDFPISETDVRVRRHERLISRAVDKPLFIGSHSRLQVRTSSAFHGLGASGGRAQGTALVIRSASIPHEIKPETILVMRSMDPGATILLAHVRGAVIERGGLLSHAAMLAREYAVPLVIGAEGVTATLVTGMTITVDGDSGEVTVDS